MTVTYVQVRTQCDGYLDVSKDRQCDLTYVSNRGQCDGYLDVQVTDMKCPYLRPSKARQCVGYLDVSKEGNVTLLTYK